MNTDLNCQETRLKRDMATQPKVENPQARNGDDQVAQSPSTVNLVETLKQRYHKIKEHAETYPYVWASYTVVYGGFGLWFAYRWRKLHKTEDRVRGLKEKLRKLVEAEESAKPSTALEKPPPSSEKPTK